MIQTIIIFTIMQMINVILSTIKSVVFYKGNKWLASSTNAIYYSFYSLIIKQISGIDNIWIILIVTAITNFLGTLIGLIITEKFEKERLWRISTTIKIEDLQNYKKELKQNNIKFITLETSWEERKVVDIFSESKKESKTIKEIINKYRAHYTVTEAKIRL